MITDEMIEKAAAAMWREGYGRHRPDGKDRWPEDVLGGSQSLFRYMARAALASQPSPQVGEWQPMSSAPTDGKHCLLAVPEPSGFIYTVQGAYQNGQWNAVHRDNVQPLYWMPNILIPASPKQETSNDE